MKNEELDLEIELDESHKQAIIRDAIEELIVIVYDRNQNNPRFDKSVANSILNQLSHIESEREYLLRIHAGIPVVNLDIVD